MSDVSQGPGWWQATDGKWYPPTATPQPTVVYAQVGPKNDGMSIAALVCGIVGLVLTFCWVGVILGILGVIFGVVGIKKIDASNGTLQGRGMALAGAICGAVSIAIFLVMIVIAIAGSSSY
jgi:hypothetical protein